MGKPGTELLTNLPRVTTAHQVAEMGSKPRQAGFRDSHLLLTQRQGRFSNPFTELLGLIRETFICQSNLRHTVLNTPVET